MNLKKIVAVSVLLGLTGSVFGLNSSTGNLLVSVNIQQNCYFDDTQSAALDFGSNIGLDSLVNLAAVGSFGYTCTSGTPNFLVRLSNGDSYVSPDRRMTNGSSEYIKYNIYKDTLHTDIWDNTGKTITPTVTTGTVPVYGMITETAPVPHKTGGTYNDTVVVTISSN